MKEIERKRLEQLGAHILKLQQERGLSARELASRCDLDFSKINKIGRGKINFTVATLIELATGLGLPPKALLDIEFDE